MKRPFNFSAGPAVLPEVVLEQAAAEMLDWQGKGISVMEMSHRSEEFESILFQAESNLRELLSIPKTYRILFIQASATALNAVIPMNLLGINPDAETIDFVHTGVWSEKSLMEARKYKKIHIVASSKMENFTRIPKFHEWDLSDKAAYAHICSNETINGTAYFFTPDTGSIPLVADMSSDILSRPVDIKKYGLIFAGAQKNMGIAGVSIIIIREDLIGKAQSICPSVYDFRNLADHHSIFNTPPVYAIYICGLVLQWLKEKGGVTAMEKEAIQKSALLYDYIDSSDLFVNYVEKDCRSRMNVPFFLKDDSLNEVFLMGARQNKIVQLQGHRLVGGMRASLYNAMPFAGVKALVSYMQEFERTR